MNFQIYYITLWDFFTSVYADGLSLEFEWQQVSSDHQDSSQYSYQSQQYCSLDNLDSSTDFQLFQSPSNFFFFFFGKLSLRLISWLGFGDLFISQNPWEFYVSFSRTDSGLCIYHLVVWSNFKLKKQFTYMFHFPCIWN